MITTRSDSLASSIDGLCPDFSGLFSYPGDGDYDQVRRVWNGMIDRRPAIIARCVCASDVAAAVRAARALDIRGTVRGGGHNVAGTAVADGTLMIDLSLMRNVVVDPARRTAEIQGGALLREVDAATAAHRLVCPVGVVSHTGFAGLALGGGYGWLARKWGLTCDHVIAADVVLADGSLISVDGDHHEDLLWALRGGGGNFGVVTRFVVSLRDAPRVYRRSAVYPLADALPALRAYQMFASKQQSDMHAVLALRQAPDTEATPPALRGQPALFVTAIWFGAPEAGPTATDELFTGPGPASIADKRLSYLNLQLLADYSEPAGHRYYTRSCYLTGLPDRAAEELLRATADISSPLSSIDVGYLSGAVSEGPAHASAFPRREAPYMCTASAQWIRPEDDDENIRWTHRTIDRLACWHYGGNYVNYIAENSGQLPEHTYGTAIYRRLAQVKNKYDPDNFFRHNHNVMP